MRKKLNIVLAAVVSMCALTISCTREDEFSFGGRESSSSSYTAPGGRSESTESRNVMLLYSAGNNSLSSSLAADMLDLEKGFVPNKGTFQDHILLVYTKQPVSYRNYSEGTDSYLYRLYRDGAGIVRRDTLRTWGPEYYASSAKTMTEVLNFVKESFPAKGYGMLFSSHASGWMPDYYYSDPTRFEGGGGSWDAPRFGIRREEFPPIPEFPMVKSIGQDVFSGGSTEIEIQDFARAIPYRLDYLLLDACLCGCVEVAHELQGKADYVGFSPAEVLSDGFDYMKVAGHLLKETPDPAQVCKDYFDQYDSRTGLNRSATITMVDTRKMGKLETICKTLFEKYRSVLQSMPDTFVQGFFRENRHFFYDLEDLLLEAGIESDEKAALSDAIGQCVVYKAHTDHFLEIQIDSYCGLTMYLPSRGSEYLDNYYKENLSWNRATELIK